VTVRSRPAQALPYLLAFVLGLGAAGLAACGNKTNPAMIPADNASELKDHLDDVLAAIESSDCGEASRAVAQVRGDLTSLPSGTSQRLEARLKEGVERLAEQAAEECQPTETTQTEAPTTTTITPETTTTPVTTATETTPVETTSTETTPPVDTVPTETTAPTDTVPPEGTGGLETP
jgi:hypothetical protein